MIKLVESFNFYDKLMETAKLAMKEGEPIYELQNKTYKLTTIQKLCCRLYLSPVFGLAVFLLLGKMNIILKILILLCLGMILPLLIFVVSSSNNSSQ